METSNYQLEELVIDQQKLINGGSIDEPKFPGMGIFGVVYQVLKTVVYIVDNLDKVRDGIKDGSAAADSFCSKMFHE